MFEQQLVNAISLGSVYALFALGFTLIFGVLGVINLSHGAVFMLGSYCALTAVDKLALPIWLALIVAMLITGTIGLIVDYLVLKPLRARNAPHLAPMIATIGVAIMLTNLAQGLFGAENQRFPQGSIPESSIAWGNLQITVMQIAIIVISLALMLILIFAVQLHWFPASGIANVGDGGFIDQLRHLVMPVVTLTLFQTGGFTRFTRASMIETLRMDHVRTARAKGAGERRVVLVHAFRNALIPVVTVMALNFGSLFGGALLTETMFAHPGMGKMIYDSILGNDYDLALTGLLFATLITLLSNLGADIAYGWLDPRITLA